MRLKLVSPTFCTLIAAVTIGSAANAGTCKLSIHRTACSPDKEKAMLKPYDQKNPTEETMDFPSDKECLAKGEELAKIVRKGTIAKKVVTVFFDAKEVGKKEGTADCK